MKLARQHTTHLLNALYTEGVSRVSVKHPCEEIGELLEIDLSNPVDTTVRFSQGALTYQDTREAIQRLWRPIKDTTGKHFGQGCGLNVSHR